MLELKNTIIYLIGYPGVGKLTTAVALCAITGAILMDNHMVNNPVFKLVGADGQGPIPAAVWDKVKAVRDVFFTTIRDAAPQQLNYVLTNVLLDGPGDRDLFAQVVDLAAQRGGLFVPVVLRCREEEMYRRVASPERLAKMKGTDPKRLRGLISHRPLLPVAHPNLLELDNTALPADESARVIIDHVQGLIKL